MEGLENKNATEPIEHEEKEIMETFAWEEVRDAFFMLKSPIDYDVENDRLSQLLTKRRRKIGRYGPRSGLVRPSGLPGLLQPEIENPRRSSILDVSLESLDAYQERKISTDSTY